MITAVPGAVACFIGNGSSQNWNDREASDLRSQAVQGTASATRTNGPASFRGIIGGPNFPKMAVLTSGQPLPGLGAIGEYRQYQECRNEALYTGLTGDT
jgi:hypothetical protein